MSNDITLDAAETIDKIQALVGAANGVREVGEATFMVVPKEFTHVDVTPLLDKLQPTPRRKSGTATLLNIDSFIGYVRDQRHNEPLACLIYANPDTSTLTAVFNDHSLAPGWRDFRAEYKVEKSRELVSWLSNNKKALEQEEFAVFLEDNIADIVEPSGEMMLAMALTMQAKTEANFQSSRRLDNGQVQLSYTETIDARAGAGQIEIPRTFTLGLRLFKNGEPWKLKARLKYRLGAGKVKFWYELDRPENVIEEAFDAYVARVTDAGYPVLIGKA